MDAALRCASSTIVQSYPPRTSEIGRSGSHTRSASQAPFGRRPNIVSSSDAIRRSCPTLSRSGSAADPGALGARREKGLVVPPAQVPPVAGGEKSRDSSDELRALGAQPLE